MLVMIGDTSAKDALKKTLQKLFTNTLASKCSGTKQNFKLKDLKIIACVKNKLILLIYLFNPYFNHIIYYF